MEDRLTRANPSASRTFAFAWGYWRRSPRALSGQLALVIVATGCDLATPWAAGHLLDVVSRPARDVAAAAWAVSALAFLYLCQYTFRSYAQWWANRLTVSGMQAIGQDLISRILRFSVVWHADTSDGATIRIASRAMDGFNTASTALLTLLGPSVLVLGGMVVSIGLKWPVAGLFVAVIVVAFVTFNLVLTSRWIQPASTRANARDTTVSATMADMLGGHAIVRNFAAETREEARFGRALNEWRETIITAWDRFTYLSFLQNGMLVVLQAGLLGILVWSWAQGRASPGDVAFGVTSFLLIAGYLRSLPETLRLVQRSFDDLAPAAAIAATPPQIRDRPRAKDLPVEGIKDGEIVFDRVTFAYPAATEPVLRGLDLRIEAGEHVALIGATGTGKSTLAGLLTRLYDVESGRILIGGVDVAEVTQASLRRAVGVVPQEPVLFHRSVFENIAYGRPGASFADVMKAAQQACAHQFIERLPNGYDTLVGERGGKLSAGERQRIAIARVFLADSRIVIFDEATSSLDVETEYSVIRAATALTQGRTTLTITHRLSTVRNADRILVLEGGRILQSGTHEQLRTEDGAYARSIAAAVPSRS